MKKVLALLLALVLVLSLAACGGGNGSNEDTNGSNEDTTSSNKNPIVGKWAMSSSVLSEIKSHNEKSTYPETIKNNGDIEFFEDGSCNAPIYICNILDGRERLISELDYSSYYTKENGKIYFSRNGNDYYDYDYSISNNQLVITIDEHPADTFETNIKTLIYERVE